MKIPFSYMWIMENGCRNLPEPTDSDHLPAEIVDNCFVYVRLIQASLPGHYCVSVRKTDATPIMVDICLKVKNYQEYYNRAYNWKNDCQFSSVVYPSTAQSIKISCDIAWPLSESPTTVTTPPRALVLPTQNFLMSSSFSDVTIVIGSEKLPAHKVILSSYSSVFCQMLSTPMKEAETNRIIIEDIDLATMKTVLTFLYKGKCEGLSEVPVACKVLVAAHKYDIQYLQDTCVHYLHQQVNAENVVDILELAHVYGKEKLEQVCWEFVMKNKKDITLSDQFKDLCMTNRGIMDQFMIKNVNASP